MAEIPIRARVRRDKLIRVRPSIQARLREAKYDLMARYRVDIDEQAILEQFFEEAFEGWLQGKLGETEPD